MMCISDTSQKTFFSGNHCEYYMPHYVVCVLFGFFHLEQIAYG